MAAVVSISVKRLQDEVSCFLCHKYFSDPVSIECGHSFCQKCISQFWESNSSSCPQCGKRCLERNFRPNQELRSIVQIAKRMQFEDANVAGEMLCESHHEPLKSFCKDEQKLLCPTCVESEDHSRHGVVSAEEAAREYKEKLEIQLQAWKGNQEKNISFHAEEEKRYKEFLEKVDANKQKIISNFEEVKEVLEQQKNTVLDELEELVKKGGTFVAKLFNTVCFGDTLIREMEEKSQQPPNQFLQDIKTTLSRYKILDYQEPSITSVLEEELHAFSKKYIVLQDTVQNIRDFLSKLDVKWANITFDPDTCSSHLQISADKKTIIKSSLFQQFPGDYPQRFTSPCVLGFPGFTSGRHYWEVKVKRDGVWAVGVTRESINRKANVSLPQEGIWEISRNSWSTFISGKIYQERDIPETIGLYLDYEGKRVAFFDAEEGTHLHTFTSASFNGEKIRPFFWLHSGSLDLVKLGQKGQPSTLLHNASGLPSALSFPVGFPPPVETSICIGFGTVRCAPKKPMTPPCTSHV